MGEVTMATYGLLPKINTLFNNPLYSDIQFVFMNEDGTCEKVYCHKLILALQSKAFAHLFFEKETSSSVMKMQASKKQLFYLLFKFMYSGDIQFHTFDIAQDLYELASDYYVEELVMKCHAYMFEGKLTIENIFLRYEHALKENVKLLLEDCRNFLRVNIQTVLKSNEFSYASPKVVEDIIKLNNLSLPTELDIIVAVLKWGLESLKRNDIPDNEKNLRQFVDPFLKHLRILSLTPSEFQYLVEQYNIFSAYESMLLTQKIMIPECDFKLSESFCCITSKRNAIISSSKTSGESQHYDIVASNSSSKSVTSHSPKSVRPNSPKSVHSNSPKSVRSNSPKSVRSNSPRSVQSEPSKSLCSNNKKISYEVHPVKSTGLSSSRYTNPVKNAGFSTSKFKPTFKSSSNITDIKFPFPNFSQHFLNYVFPLVKSEQSFELSFRKDIKCWVLIKMKKGNLSLHGLELKVKKKSEKKEELEVCVSVEGFSKESYEDSYNLELQNDVLSVKFSKPMKLQEGNKGKLEVSIDNLALDRCSQIVKKPYALNTGLNFECEFSINSNKKIKDEENFLFLINKLIYVPF